MVLQLRNPIRNPKRRWKKPLTTLTATCLLSLITPASTWVIPDQEVFSKSTAHGAVASENARCSEIGIELLRRGGNAADAMVGTTLCVGVTAPYHSGIGGGGFMLVRSPNGTYESIDFREMAPAAAFEDMYQGNENGSVFGGLAVGVPGEIMGLEYLHQRYGRLNWRDVVGPAVEVARDGFRVGEDMIRYITFATLYGGNYFVEDPNWAIDFAPNGRLLELGETITRNRYADTLEIIGNHGAEAFYHGPMAKAIVEAVQATNGTMTLTDMANYKIYSRPTASITYRGYKLFSCGAPSSGAVALSTFKTIEGYTDMSDPSLLNLSTHRLDEALRFAYAAHNELGDPEFVDEIDVYAFEKEMLEESTAREIRARISDEKTREVRWYNPRGLRAPDTHGTSHVVSADGEGMSVSLTTTVNTLFGSGVLEPETGIILNNQMNDFSIPNSTNAFGYVPLPNNFIRPHKRPLSSITPIIIEKPTTSTSLTSPTLPQPETSTSTSPNTSLYITIGAAGGSRIITSTIQAIWHLLDHSMNMSAALSEPRLHDQLIPDIVSFEEGFDVEVVRSMEGKGHKWGWVRRGLSAVQGVRAVDFEGGVWEAAGEPRQVDSGGRVL